jgi:hypothetical protein
MRLHSQTFPRLAKNQLKSTDPPIGPLFLPGAQLNAAITNALKATGASLQRGRLRHAGI